MGGGRDGGRGRGGGQIFGWFERTYFMDGPKENIGLERVRDRLQILLLIFIIGFVMISGETEVNSPKFAYY